MRCIYSPSILNPHTHNQKWKCNIYEYLGNLRVDIHKIQNKLIMQQIQINTKHVTTLKTLNTGNTRKTKLFNKTNHKNKIKKSRQHKPMVIFKLKNYRNSSPRQQIYMTDDISTSSNR